MPLALNKKIIWELACNVVMALLFIQFLLAFIHSYIETGALSSLLYIIYDTILIVFLLIRRIPDNVTTAPWEWVVAICGTFSTLLMRPIDVPLDSVPLLCLQVFGILISLTGLLSLFRSYGTIPANRGIRTNGLYRFIRHPLYAGYVLSIGSFLIQNFSLWNLSIFAFHITMQLMRIFMEEKLLSKDPAYAAYMQKTKWRLIPFVW